MTTDRRPTLGPVLLTVLLDLLGFGLVIPLLSFYAESFSATAVQVTALMASYSVAQFFFAPLWGGLSDRIGRRPVMIASIAGTVVFLSLFASATSIWQLFLFRTLHGACAANIGAAQAYVADVTTPETRAKGMGLIGASFGLGFTFGPVVGGLLAPISLTAPIWLAAALSAINLVWTVFRLPESRQPGASSERTKRTMNPAVVWSVLRHPVVGRVILLGATATFSFAMLESTFALVAEHVWSMDARTVGMMFGIIGVLGIVIQGGLIGRLVKRFGERNLLTVGYGFTASGMALLAMTHPGAVWFSHGWGPILAGCVLLAVGTSLSNPSITGLVSRSTSPDEQGRVLGVYQSLAALSRALAPTTGGLLYAHWFTGGAFAAGAALMGFALLVAAPQVLRQPHAGAPLR